MSTPEDYAKIVVSYPDERKTVMCTVTLHTEGIELDEVVDALLVGLKATEGRTYTVEAAQIVESVSRPPAAIALVKRPTPVRPVKRRVAADQTESGMDPSTPVTPVDESPRVTPRA